MNNNTAINNQNVIALASAWTAASEITRVAFEAYDAAQSLSKRSKSRDLLIAATKPAYDAAKATSDAAYATFTEARDAAYAAIEVAHLDAAVDSALQRATVRLNVDYAQVASLNAIASRFRKSVEQGEFKGLQNIGLSGLFEGIDVTIETSHRNTIRQFDVGFTLVREGREGKKYVSRFSPVRVDLDGFNLTSTNIGRDEIAAHSFSKAWQVAEILADVCTAAAALVDADRKALNATLDAVFDAADAARKPVTAQ
jgi:hypothetical protein